MERTVNENPKTEIRNPKAATRHLWSWPLTVPVMLGVFSVWVVLMLFTLGCRTDAASLAKYQAEYKAATNTVAEVHALVQPYIPAPMNAASETVFAIVTGLLAAWNTWQHRQITLLKNGKSNGNGTQPVAAPAAPG